jgi:hypothetical protein
MAEEHISRARSLELYILAKRRGVLRPIGSDRKQISLKQQSAVTQVDIEQQLRWARTLQQSQHTRNTRASGDVRTVELTDAGKQVLGAVASEASAATREPTAASNCAAIASAPARFSQPSRAARKSCMALFT